MPQDDLYLPSSIISKLFAQVPQSLPKSSLTIDDAQRNKTAKVDREKLPAWKQFLQGGLESIAGASTLSDPNEDLKNPYGYGKTLGELVQLAGIPFPLGKKVFHGSPNAEQLVKEGFDLSKNDIGDTLGSFIHFAEEPHYADAYALGQQKSHRIVRPGVVPAELKANNILDLTGDLPPEDLERLLANVNEVERSKLKEKFKIYRRDRSQYNPQNRDWFHSYLRSAIENSPERFERTGFDAIKYTDIKNPSYAIPDPTIAVGPYDRKPLGISPKLKQKYPEQTELPGGGLLLRKHWADRPMTDVTEPQSEIYKQYSNIDTNPYKWSKMESDTPSNWKELMKQAEYLGIDTNKYAGKPWHELENAIAKANPYK